MRRILALLLALTLTGLTGHIAAEGMDQGVYELARTHGFRMGAALSFFQLKDAAYLALLEKHFNSITPTNEMKAYSLLDQAGCKASADGMPVMNYWAADQMIAWAAEHGIGVRGHVLVWDAYMLDWYFHEGYDSSKPYAAPEVIAQRTESYITQVITHFEEKFPGVVYCWDVVNEAVGDSAGEYRSGDPRHLRTLRSGNVNLFREHMGDDYVEKAFLYARNTVDALGADIRLYYNDYNAYFPEKAAAIRELARSVNTYAQLPDGTPRQLMDGIGMQGYIGGYGTQSGCLEPGHLDLIREAIEEYAAMGMEVQITEMAVRNFDPAKSEQHALYYADLFRVFCGLQSETGNPLCAVTIWGLTDYPKEPKGTYVYNLNSPYGGLVDEHLEYKDAFFQVYRVLQEP